MLDSSARSAELYRPGVLADLGPTRGSVAAAGAGAAGAASAGLAGAPPTGAPAAPTAPSTAPGAPHLARIVARSSDRVGWLRARSRGITATDVAKLSTPRSVRSAAWDKLHGTGFTGNVYTQHGRAREPEIAAWVAATHGIQPSDALFHAEHDRRHLATPDGLALRPTGRIELAEIKTTAKPFRSIPRSYLRQIWWQQYVLGADRTLFVWEQHAGFVPVHDEPQCQWVDRDDAEIAKLVSLAADLIELLRQATSGAGAAPTSA